MEFLRNRFVPTFKHLMVVSAFKGISNRTGSGHLHENARKEDEIGKNKDNKTLGFLVEFFSFRE